MKAVFYSLEFLNLTVLNLTKSGAWIACCRLYHLRSHIIKEILILYCMVNLFFFKFWCNEQCCAPCFFIKSKIQRSFKSCLSQIWQVQSQAFDLNYLSRVGHQARVPSPIINKSPRCKDLIVQWESEYKDQTLRRWTQFGSLDVRLNCFGLYKSA